jgi:hypothetical protein
LVLLDLKGMANMKTKIGIGMIVGIVIVTGAFALNDRSQAGDKPDEKAAKKPPGPTTTQVLMKDKLANANKALEGLAVADFDKIAESAQMMRMISRAASWYVIGSDEYSLISKNFQEQAGDLERHAKEKNLDAASLDYMRITVTCVQCHKYMRDYRGKAKP